MDPRNRPAVAPNSQLSRSNPSGPMAARCTIPGCCAVLHAAAPVLIELQAGMEYLRPLSFHPTSGSLQARERQHYPQHVVQNALSEVRIRAILSELYRSFEPQNDCRCVINVGSPRANIEDVVNRQTTSIMEGGRYLTLLACLIVLQSSRWITYFLTVPVPADFADAIPWPSCRHGTHRHIISNLKQTQRYFDRPERILHPSQANRPPARFSPECLLPYFVMNHIPGIDSSRRPRHDIYQVKMMITDPASGLWDREILRRVGIRPQTLPRQVYSCWPRTDELIEQPWRSSCCGEGLP